jgi:hypothetical protein
MPPYQPRGAALIAWRSLRTEPDWDTAKQIMQGDQAVDQYGQEDYEDGLAELAAQGWAEEHALGRWRLTARGRM